MNKTSFTLCLLGGMNILGCASLEVDLGGDAAPSLIPRKVLFGNPDKAGPELSPDGRKLAYLAPVDGVLNVWVGPLDDPAAAKPVTRDTNRGIRIYFWAYTNRHVIYLQDSGGDENWRVYCVDLEGGGIKDLTPLEGVRAEIQEVSRKFPTEILIGLNDRKRELHDIYRVDIVTGERELVLENPDPGYAGFVTDEDFAVRLATDMRPDGGRDFYVVREGGEWPHFDRVPMEDSMNTGPRGFDKTGQVLYFADSRGRDTGALYARDLETGKRVLLAEDSRGDVGGTLRHPTERNVQAVTFTHERRRWEILDEAIEPDMTHLATVARGDVSILSRSLDDETWLVAYMLDDGPVRYYSYDRARRQAHFLFTNRTELENTTLARMHPAVIQSRDELDLVCYLTLPPESDSDGDARPDEPLPTVLLVHGGPWGRDSWGYNSLHQWLANRGYAVLGVNFRGSTGFGKAFVNAGNLEWAGKMHDDLIDAVDWAVREGIADRDRFAIMGGSYGGYATLVGMTFTPEVFACGVDIVGPSNIVTLLNTIPAYWKPMIELFTTRVGDHRTEEGRAFLDERSPLTHVDRIRRPLLIGQGANDPRVKQSESDQIVQAMREKGIPVTYVLYPDEGHGFRRPENSMSFNAVVEGFLAQNLGGRVEPIGSDFEGASIAVPAGADDVPGLKDALDRAGN